jgi:hypothetical protein
MMSQTFSYWTPMLINLMSQLFTQIWPHWGQIQGRNLLRVNPPPINIHKDFLHNRIFFTNCDVLQSCSWDHDEQLCRTSLFVRKFMKKIFMKINEGLIIWVHPVKNIKNYTWKLYKTSLIINKWVWYRKRNLVSVRNTNQIKPNVNLSHLAY